MGLIYAKTAFCGWFMTLSGGLVVEYNIQYISLSGWTTQHTSFLETLPGAGL